MAKTSKEDKNRNFCKDCMKNQEECGKDPIECRKADGAETYFKYYESTFARLHGRTVR